MEEMLDDARRGKADRRRAPRTQALVALTTATLMIAVLAGCSAGAVEPSDSDDTSMSDADTVEETEAVEPEGSAESPAIKIEDLRIPDNLDDQALAEAFIDVSNQWWVAGASDELRMDRFEANLSWEEYLPLVAEANAEIFAPALYGPEWESNEVIRNEVAGNVDGNLNYLLNYTATAWNVENPENKEAYVSWMTVNKVTNVVSTDTERTLKITYDNHNNADMNSVDDDALRNSGAVEPVFRAVDGYVIVVDIDRQ